MKRKLAINYVLQAREITLIVNSNENNELMFRIISSDQNNEFMAE